MATQQTFLQVSQSGYTNVIDSHASLQSWRLKIILSSERFSLVRCKQQHERSLQMGKKKSPRRIES